MELLARPPDRKARGLDKACQSLGLDITAVESAEVALELLRSDDRFELLFTDVELSGPINGFALTERARSLIPALKVLYTSGYFDAATPPAGLGTGSELLVKPYRRAQFVEALRLLFQSNRMDSDV